MQNSKFIFEQLSMHYRATHQEIPTTIKSSADLMASDLPSGLTENEIRKAFVSHRQKAKVTPCASHIIKEVQSSKVTTKPIERKEVKLLPRTDPSMSLVVQRQKRLIKGPISDQERREAIQTMTDLTKEHTGLLSQRYNEYLTFMMLKGEYHPEILAYWNYGAGVRRV